MEPPPRQPQHLGPCHQTLRNTYVELSILFHLYLQPVGIRAASHAPQRRFAEHTLQHQRLRHGTLPGRHGLGSLPHLRRSQETLLIALADSCADLSIGGALAADGRVLLLITHGRRTGRNVTAAVGFVEQPDGSLVVAARAPETHWSLNLMANPACEVAYGGRLFHARAEQLSGSAFSEAITALILRYGTPSERLGRGPAFRLVPLPHMSAP